MADIDLIPNEYRLWLWQLRWLKGFGIALALLVIVFITGYVLTANQLKNTVSEMAKLQKEKAITTMQRDKLQRLDNEKNELERQWTLLNGLRGGTTVQDILRVTDKAFGNNDLWFTNWQFARTGVVIDNKESTRESGYFIIVPSKNANNKDGESWEIQTHVKISGQALNHAALSGFVSRMLEQPQISNVRIVQTSLLRNNAGSFVVFELAVMVSSLKGAA
jgi:hypothetical protein